MSLNAPSVNGSVRRDHAFANGLRFASNGRAAAFGWQLRIFLVPAQDTAGDRFLSSWIGQ
jgi:hypothetical protein